MIYNYYTDLVIKIDLLLLAASVSLSLITILYSIVNDHLDKRRSAGLLNIKRHVYELTLSEKEMQVCMPVTTQATPRQFLDVQTNRNRSVFFNASEQEAFMRCFVSTEKVAEIEKTARGAKNKWRRVEAILALGYTGTGDAAKILKNTIFSRDEDISYFSIVALGRLKSNEAAKILLDFVRKKPSGRYEVTPALGDFPPETADEVMALTKSGDPELRTWAVELLSAYKPSHYRKEIEALTQDESAGVRAAACYCLGKLSGSESRDVLRKLLKDDFWLVRSNAVKALSEVMGAESIPDVIGLINDGSLSVIDSVREAMAKHIERALPYIEKMHRGWDELAKRIAAEALDKAGYDPETRKPRTNSK